MSNNDTTTDNDTDNVYEIPAHNLPALQSKLDEMNRRAVKLGCEPITLNIIGEFEVTRKREFTGVKYKVRMVKIVVVGQTPKLNGWQLMAAIERQESGENLVRCVPGKTVPESYRKTDTHCDHCHTVRYRKEVFVLTHDDGRWAQVGRSCIADFLGHHSVENICGRAAWDMDLADELGSAEDEGYGGSRGETLVSMLEFVAATAICVRRLGWLSKTKAAEMGEGGPMPTSSVAWRICTSNDRYTKDFVDQEKLFVEDRDMELAGEAIAWGQSHGTEGVSDYLYNLGVACRLEFVNYKTSGIVASVIAAYLREKEQLVAKAKKAPSKHVGTVGDRQGFTGVTVESLKYIESDYGVKTLCRFKTADGDTLIWWASNSEWLKEGETVDFTGTIKKHTEYKGWLQTELSRVAAGLPKAKTPRKKTAPVSAPVSAPEALPCPF